MPLYESNKEGSTMSNTKGEDIMAFILGALAGGIFFGLCLLLHSLGNL